MTYTGVLGRTGLGSFILGRLEETGNTPTDTGSGGIVLGGLATDTHNVTLTDVSTGGICFGGLADEGKQYTDTASGGVVLGGIAEDSLTYDTFPNGYRYRRSVVIPAGKVTTDIEQFYLLLVAHLEPTHVLNEVFRVEDESDNVLDFELREYDSGLLRLAVKADLAADNDNILRIYYGL